MSYQVLGMIYFGAAVAGFVVMGLTFATFTQLAKKYLLERASKKEVDHSKEGSADVEPPKEPAQDSDAVPAPNVVSLFKETDSLPKDFAAQLKDEASRSLEAESPVLFKGTWYGGVRKAAALLGIDVDRIRRSVEKSQPQKDLFDPNGHYQTAVLHRVFPLGDPSSRLVISDYEVSPNSKDKVSRGYVKRGKKRIPIDLEVPTGPDGDSQLLTRAQAC